MKFAALISGGKDSIFNVLECLNQGHELVALINLHPPLGKDELDSYMYQTVGHEAINYISFAIGEIPLYRYQISGKAVSTNLEYTENLNNSYDNSDEVEDLFQALTNVKNDFKDLEGISSGAILSNYQRIRVENVCERLGLISLAFMWQRSQIELLNTMLNCGMNPILIKIAALGLNGNDHLGKPLRSIADDIIKKSDLYGLNPCGEGGEYETLTLDAPFFQKAIEVKSSDVVVVTETDYGAVKYLKINEIQLKEKLPQEFCSSKEFYGSHLWAKLNLKQRTESKSIINELKSELRKVNNKVTRDLCDLNSKPRVVKIVSTSVDLSSSHRSENSTIDAVNEAFGKVKQLLIDQFNTTIERLVYCVFFVPDIDHAGPAVNFALAKLFPNSRLPGVTYIRNHNDSRNSPTKIDLHCLINYTDNINSTHLRIQSRSHWTPAAIGRFSQAVSLSPKSGTEEDRMLCFLSGQVALHAEDSSLIDDGTIEQECALGLLHVTRLSCFNYRLSWHQLSFMVCYCTDSINMIVCRSVFHSTVCQSSSIDDSNYDEDHNSSRCLCHRVLWVTVSVGSLPKQANIQWQPVFARNQVDFATITRTCDPCRDDLIIFQTDLRLNPIDDVRKSRCSVITIKSFLDRDFSVVQSGIICIEL